MNKLKIVLAICCLPFTQIYGQKPLSIADEKYIKSQAIEYIKQFKQNLQELGSTNDLSEKEKNILITSTLSYFRKGATVEVMNKKGTNSYSTEDYLKNIVANYKKRFSVVYTTIETTNFNVSDLIPVKDANGNIISYKCTTTYVQGFCAKKVPVNGETFKSEDADNYDICNKTWKTLEITIEKRFSSTVGNRWMVLLSDIKATKMKDLKKD